VFRVIVEQEARENIRALYDELKTRNPGSSYPVRWFDEIRVTIAALAESAERCGLAYEDRFFAETIRQRLHESYKVLFTIRGDHVHVLHVRHQHQEPASPLP
jgi:plasmid stabilization system protein ParE